MQNPTLPARPADGEEANLIWFPARRFRNPLSGCWCPFASSFPSSPPIPPKINSPVAHWGVDKTTPRFVNVLFGQWQSPHQMSEVAFFMNRQDTSEFVGWLVASLELRFIDEWAHELPLPCRCEAEEVVATIFGVGHHRRFALIHPDWSPHPLQSSRIVSQNGSRPYHSLCQRYGSPSFDLIASRVALTDEGTPFIVRGTFSDYPFYYLERGSPTTVQRPEEMAAIWKQVQSYLRRNGRRTIRRERQSVGP
jgi:hypothetical protein